MIRLWVLTLAVVAAVAVIHPADTIAGRLWALASEFEAMTVPLETARDRHSTRRALSALRHCHTWPSTNRWYGNDGSEADREECAKLQSEGTARFVKAVLRLKKDGLLPDDSRFLPPLVRPIVEAYGGENEQKANAIIAAIQRAGRGGGLCETPLDSTLLDFLVVGFMGTPRLAGGEGATVNPWGRRYELIAIETSRGTMPRVISCYPCGGRELYVEFPEGRAP
jgi:hypothetical protein